MKTIGMIGGMSWESTVTYYQVINEAVRKALGGFHSAKILMASVDFAEIEQCQRAGQWALMADILTDAAKGLEGAGADFILICTNTMHKVAPQVQDRLSIPVVHIAEATADALEQKSIRKVALLGTRYTMTQDFYKDRLIERGIEVLTPNAEDVDLVNGIIFNELCMGVIRPESKQALLAVIRKLAAKGAEGVILGCTEIGLLVAQEDVSLPVFDTTLIHAEKAAALALND